MEKGSIGSGFSITEGVTTEVETLPSEKQNIRVFINEQLSEAPVSKFMVKKFFGLIEKKYTVTLKHRIKLPISAGFGLSGAGALSTALALNEELNLDLSKIECGQIAHTAEVENRTGLGDVIGSYFGGFEVRIKPGAPGIGKIRKISISPDVCVICATEGILETKKVLSDNYFRNNIIKSGDRYLQEILNNSSITVSEIIQISRKFSFEIGLLTQEMEKILISLEEAGFRDSSMIMLGKSIFCLTDKRNMGEVHSILKKELASWSIINTTIDHEGARLIEK